MVETVDWPTGQALVEEAVHDTLGLRQGGFGGLWIILKHIGISRINRGLGPGQDL